MRRMTEHAAFLATAGWADATAKPLAGDASARRYTRLTHPDGRRAVLMDAPKAAGEQTAPFVRVARHLTQAGFSAPAILAWDEPAGLLLLEDLGDALLTRICETDPAQEPDLYATSAHMLAALHDVPVPDWAQPYGPDQMAAMVAPYWEHHRALSQDQIAALQTTMHDALSQHDAAPVLILRDFHAENLVWLPDRAGHAALGLLDFQDALAGHPIYDLVSLIQDARRAVSPVAARAAILAFCDATGRDAEDVIAAMAVQGLQRNLRILGIFARLIRAGKPKYQPLMPRVQGYVDQALNHPACTKIARVLT